MGSEEEYPPSTSSTAYSRENENYTSQGGERMDGAETDACWSDVLLGHFHDAENVEKEENGVGGSGTLDRALEVVEAQLKVVAQETSAIVEAHLPSQEGGRKDTGFLASSLAEVQDNLRRLSAGVKGAMKRGIDRGIGTMNGASVPAGKYSNNPACSKTAQRRVVLLEAFIETLERVCECTAILENFDAAFASWDVIKSSRALARFDSKQAELVDTISCSSSPSPSPLQTGSDDSSIMPGARILRALRVHGRKRRAKLGARLEKLLSDALRFRNMATAGRTEFASELQVNVETATAELKGGNNKGAGIVLTDILCAMHISGGLTRAFKRRVRSNLLRSFVGPCLSKLGVSIDVSRDGSTAFMRCSVAKSIVAAAPIATPTSHAARATAVYSNLLKMLEFLELEVCGVEPHTRCSGSANSVAMQALGKMLWENSPDDDVEGADVSVSAGLLKLLGDCTPDDASSPTAMEEFSHVAKLTKRFERELVAMGILLTAKSVNGETMPDPPPLTHYVENVEMEYARKRRCALLARARAALMNPSCKRDAVEAQDSVFAGKSVSSGGECRPSCRSGADLFHLPPMKVTKSAQIVVALAHNTMNEATKSATPEIAEILYQTSRDISSLIRVFALAANKSELARGRTPRASALLHNDCTYVAHHLCVMGHKYRPNLPVSLSHGAITVDLYVFFSLRVIFYFVFG